MTVDAFTSESNSVLPRFFTCYAEPAAEVEDAFAVQDWQLLHLPIVWMRTRSAWSTTDPRLGQPQKRPSAPQGGARAVWSEVDSKYGELVIDIRSERSMLTTHAKVSLRSLYHPGAEQLFQYGAESARDSEQRYHDGTSAVSALCLGHKVTRMGVG